VGPPGAELGALSRGVRDGSRVKASLDGMMNTRTITFAVHFYHPEDPQVQLAAHLAEHEIVRAAGRDALEECLRERLAGREGGESSRADDDRRLGVGPGAGYDLHQDGRARTRHTPARSRSTPTMSTSMSMSTPARWIRIYGGRGASRYCHRRRRRWV